MSEQRLRDCPFCGGNAVECFTKVPPAEMTSNAWAEGYVIASIACGKCGARAKQYSLDTGSREPSGVDVEHALSNARIHWTARVNPPELTAAQQRVASLELDLKVQADNVAHFKQVIEQETMRADETQQRVAELERENELIESLRAHDMIYIGGLERDNKQLRDDNAKLVTELEAENARLLKRVDDLEVAVANGMNDATRFVDRNGWLESEHERLKQEIERLRGLLRECLKYLPLKGTTYNAMACQDSKLEDRIKAELGSE